MQSHLCSIISNQLNQILLVNIEILSKTLLHCVTLNSNTHYWILVQYTSYINYIIVMISFSAIEKHN